MEDRYLSHLREQCSWPRITRLKYSCLLSHLERISSPETSDPHTLRIQICLQPFERILLARSLDSLEADTSKLSTNNSETFAGDINLEVAAIVLFFRWSWADNVLRTSLIQLDPHWVRDVHGGDLRSALEQLRLQLRTRIRSRSDLYDRRYYRTEQLMRDNTELGSRDAIAMHEITVVPDPTDMLLWKRLGAYVLQNTEHTATFPGLKGEVAEMLRLLKSEGVDSVKRYVERLFEETPDFPPPDLLEDMDEEASDSSNVEGEEVGDEEVTVQMNSDKETTAHVSSDQQIERTQDWARITTQNITEAENLWDVWSLCRMALVSMHNSQYRAEFDEFLACEEFTRNWRVSEDEDGVTRVIVPGEPLSEILSLRQSEIAGNFFKEDAQEFLEVEDRRRAHEIPITDPFHQLCFIPWDLLETIKARDLSDLASGLGLEATVLDNTLCTADAQLHDYMNHTLYVTDDLFAPHIESNYKYPVFMKGNKIVYSRQRVCDTGLMEQLRYYWELFNDCAITYDSTTGDFYLLQTLPGVKMRQLEKRAGLWSAMDFFDLKCRYRDTLSLQYDTLRQILGSEYIPSYGDFLLYIDHKEIEFTGMQSVGEGSFGRVYRARWHRKPKKAFDRVEESVGDVALKVALGKRSWDDRAKFFLELSTVYSALAGDSSGCVPFYGFCKVFVDETGQILGSNAHKEPSSAVTETFALVFDFAEYGDILSFLKQKLAPGEPEENWLIICTALSSLAGGLMTIHKKGIIHRDIHPQNVMVQPTRLARTSDDDVDFDCLLSDLGEGKDITRSARENASKPSSTFKVSSSSNNTTTFSLEEFIPPGAANNPEGSFEDDIFAWGQLGVDIVRNNYELLRDERGEVIYPAILMKVLERCLDPNPAGRFDAKSLVVVMEEALDGPSGLAASAYGKETEWYDGSYGLPRLRNKLSTTYELRSQWLTLTSRKRVADAEL